MKVAVLTTDNREHLRDYESRRPQFGTAPEALLQGFAVLPGIEVHVLSCTQKPLQSPETLAPNIFYHSLHVPKIGWMRTFYQGCIRATRRKLSEIKPDIAHGQGTERDCAISAVFSNFLNVVTIHGNMAELAQLFGAGLGSYSWSRGAPRKSYPPGKRRGSFCNSAYTQQLVRRRAKKTWLVPNALRSAFFETLPDRHNTSGKCILLVVGSIIPRKRAVDIMDAAKTIWQQGIDFELQFIGPADPSNPYAAAFLKRIKDEPHASYLGELDTSALIEHYDAASGLIHFPSEEAFGPSGSGSFGARLEIFRCSRVGGISDIGENVPGVELFDKKTTGKRLDRSD